MLTTGMLVAGQGGGRYPAVRWVRGPRARLSARRRESEGPLRCNDYTPRIFGAASARSDKDKREAYTSK